MAFDFTDFYVKYEGHPRYSTLEVDENEIVEVIVQKIETVLFTNKGEVLGEPNFGADLEKYLHETRVSADFVEREIIEQIAQYIPELDSFGYTIEVTFAENPESYSDIMFVHISFRETEVNAFFA
jgi:predicted component of type VI protein secretion system